MGKKQNYRLNYKYAHQYRKGHSIGTQFGFQTNGLYTNADQLVNAPTGSFGAPVLGDIIYKNQSPEDDNVIDESDKVALGNTLPEIIFGATLGGNYKGFDIQCNLEGSALFSTFYTPNKFTPYAYENRWNPANPTVQTAYPGLSISRDFNTQTLGEKDLHASHFVGRGGIHIPQATGKKNIPFFITSLCECKQSVYFLKCN